MSVGRQFNWKGQQRVDVAHLRLVESSIAYDFDTLAGKALCGGNPHILKGFEIASWAVGLVPSTLQLITAGSVVFHYGASENGTILFVPEGRPSEVLAVTNYRVLGGFVYNAVNYIGIDFIRLEDSTTTDIVQFVDATTKIATPKTIPLGRVLDYRILISTTPFSSTSNVCPIAIVQTDTSGLVATVTDARSMYFRLAAGGDSPNPLGTYNWPQGRAPEVATSFTGGDKAITNEKTWKSAIMQRLWEVTGGEYWYSDVTDRNLKFYCSTPMPFSWNSGTNTITWAGDLSIALDNSTGTVNTITASPATGLIMADGTVAYVELNRFSNATLTPVVVATAAYNALPMPVRPGSRYIIFWRKGTEVFTRLDYTPVGTFSGSATTLAFGLVKTNSTNVTVGGPFAVISDSFGGNATAAGLTRQGLTAGTITIGSGANDTSIVVRTSDWSGGFVFGAGSFDVLAGNGARIHCSTPGATALNVVNQGRGDGLRAYGASFGIGTGDGGVGVYGIGGEKGSTGLSYAGHGVFGQGAVTGSNNKGCGVYGLGGTNADGWGTSYGVYGVGGPNANVQAPGVVGLGGQGGVGGPGVKGYGSGTGGIGVVGVGSGPVPGVEGTGGNYGAGTGNGGDGVVGTGGSRGATTGAAGAGLRGQGGPINGIGVVGSGVGTGSGVWGQATGGNGNGVSGYGATPAGTGAGVYGEGGATNGVGVSGLGTGFGSGGKFVGGASGGHGIYAAGGGSGFTQGPPLYLISGSWGVGMVSYGGSGPVAGMIVFNAADSKFYGYDGALWRAFH